MKPPRITLYSAPGCPHCRQARDYLHLKGLRFLELDVQRNPRGRKEFARLGARGVPVLLIGEARVDGFDRRRIDAAVKAQGDA